MPPAMALREFKRTASRLIEMQSIDYLAEAAPDVNAK